MQFYNFNGSFLIPNTIYYARAYATNNAGASYSNEIQIVAAVPQIGDYDYSGGIVISVDSGTRQYVVMSL